MWLILTDTGDPEGHWLADGLGPRLPGPIVHLTGRDLVDGCRWEHRFDDQGEWFRLYTAGGVIVDNRNVRGVVNRLRVLPAGLFNQRRLASRHDTGLDTGAMLLGCLNTFTCPVLNPPGAHGVSGDQRPSHEWMSLAQRAGFRCPPGTLARAGRDSHKAGPLAWEGGIRGLPTRQILVIGHRLLAGRHASDLPEDVAACCRRLAAFARSPLLSVNLVEISPSEWCFHSADAHPSLMPGGIPVLDAIAAALGPTLAARARPFAAASSTLRANHPYQIARPEPEVFPAPQLIAPGLV